MHFSPPTVGITKRAVKSTEDSAVSAALRRSIMTTNMPNPRHSNANPLIQLEAIGRRLYFACTVETDSVFAKYLPNRMATWVQLCAPCTRRCPSRQLEHFTTTPHPGGPWWWSLP